MSKIYNKLEINVKGGRNSIIAEVDAVQNDSNSRYLDVVLLDGSTPIDLTGHEVRLFMRKPEKSGEIWNDGEITDAKAGRCQFLMTTGALSKAGHLETQISIWKDNTEILSTPIFRIFVTESLHTTGSIESSNEYGALVVLFRNLYEAHDLMIDMVQNIGEPGDVAKELGIATMWEAWESMSVRLQDAIHNNSVDGVMQRLGETDDTGATATEGTVMGKSNAILNALSQGGMPIVKTVQSGMTRGANSYGAQVEILIAEVNPSRCIVVLNGTKNSSSAMGGVALISLAKTKLTLLAPVGDNFSWQVIEFY